MHTVMINRFAFWCSRKDEHGKNVFSLEWFVEQLNSFIT